MPGESPEEPSIPEPRPYPTPPPRRSAEVHAAILDAAYDQLESVGYHKMTVEGVAAQAGVGKATLYRRWASKAQLVVEALSKRCKVEPITPSGDLRADVRALVQYAIAIIYKTPFGQVIPQLAVELAGDPQARAILSGWLGPPRAGHQALLYSAAGREDLPHDIDAPTVLDLLGGIVLWRTLFGGQRPDDRLVDQLTALIVDRVLPRTGPPDDQHR